MKTLEWSSDREFAVDGVKFRCDVGDYTGKTDRGRFVLLKDRAVLEQYAAVFAGAEPRTILEFGIFQGGSPTLFSLWFGAEKFVGIDLCEPVAAFDEFCRSHPVGKSISTHYGVSQTDRARIEHIVRSEFGNVPVDLIIDDASHRYRDTRETFEIAFPLLRPGGTYVIEDWGWAHWQGHEKTYPGQTPLSVLVMELLMLCASRGDLIEEVRAFSAFVFIRKSREAAKLENFKLDESYLQRDVTVVGTQDLRLESVARLAGRRFLQLARRRLHRTKEKIRRLLPRGR